MGSIKLLDCTLRDGGYINNWEFGKYAIKDIKENLEMSGTEIIELGFLRDEGEDKDRTVFNNIEQVKKLIGKKVPNREYAVMAEVSNPYPLDKLEPASPDGPEIIRVIVWKRMLKEGLEYCREIVNKGYKLCVQPARVTQYSDEEFVDMLNMYSELNPYAIYVVDSWGTMYKEDLEHYLKIANETLPQHIAIGYHGHNNMMQAFDAACMFCNYKMDRDLIIDASVYGIGRGAGNLNSEIFAKYANERLDKNYNIDNFTNIFDKYISAIYEKTKWGYSIPYLITAKYNANPNFAGYYTNCEYSIKAIEECISSMPQEERIIFTKEKADNYYEKICSKYKDSNNDHYKKITTQKYYSKKLCVIIITANRAMAVYGFLLASAKKFAKMGIDLIVYDSSTNNETKNITEKFSKNFNNVIYERWLGEYDGVSIDNKVIDAYKKYAPNYEYIWTTRDGLSILIDKIIDKINHKMLSKKDIIVVNDYQRDIKEYGTKDYYNPALFFKEQCTHTNTLGTFILRSSFVTDLIKNIPLDDKTYGMYVPFAFFYYYAKHKTNASYVVGNLWGPNIGAVNSSFWTRKILWQWGERWFIMIDKLPEIYDTYKKDVLKIQTIDFKPFSIEYLLKARYYKGLSISLVNKYKKYLPYVCDTPLWVFYLISCLPKFASKEIAVNYNRILLRKIKKRQRLKQKIRKLRLKKGCINETNI